MERGRFALVRCSTDGSTAEISGSADYSVRSLVNAYGGAFAPGSGVIYFVNYRGGPDSDQRLYRLSADSQAAPLTPDTQGQVCYGDLVVDAGRRRLLAVQQNNLNLNASGQPTQRLVVVDAQKGGIPQRLQYGNDFYASPCLSPDGRQLAWLAWNYPHMPWDASEVWLAGIDEEGALQYARRIARNGDAASGLSAAT